MLERYELIAPHVRREPRLPAMIYRWMIRGSERRREKQERREIAEMAKLGDHILRDIGLTHGDVHRATRWPLDVNAGQYLNRLARRDL